MTAFDNHFGKLNKSTSTPQDNNKIIIKSDYS